MLGHIFLVCTVPSPLSMKMQLHVLKYLAKETLCMQDEASGAMSSLEKYRRLRELLEILATLYQIFEVDILVPSILCRANRKSQVRQCLGFCSADS